MNSRILQQTGVVIVVGGWIAGIQASLDLAERRLQGLSG